MTPQPEPKECKCGRIDDRAHLCWRRKSQEKGWKRTGDPLFDARKRDFDILSTTFIPNPQEKYSYKFFPIVDGGCFKHAVSELEGVHCQDCGKVQRDCYKDTPKDGSLDSATREDAGVSSSEDVVLKSRDPSWEKELNRKFFGGIPEEEMGSNQVEEKELKSFISKLLEEQRERWEDTLSYIAKGERKNIHQQTLEEVAKVIKDWKKSKTHNLTVGLVEALQDILEKIKTLKAK